jgi:hypothetical protein
MSAASLPQHVRVRGVEFDTLWTTDDDGVFKAGGGTTLHAVKRDAGMAAALMGRPVAVMFNGIRHAAGACDAAQIETEIAAVAAGKLSALERHREALARLDTREAWLRLVAATLAETEARR